MGSSARMGPHGDGRTRRGALRLGLGAGAAMALPRPGRAAAGRLDVRVVPYPLGYEMPSPAARYDEPDRGAALREFTHGGRARRYRLHRPSDGRSANRMPIVLLHGSQRTGLSMIDMWWDVAEAEREVVLIAPDGLDGGWAPELHGPDYLVALLEDVSRHVAIAPPVCVFGHSAGGILAQLLANRGGLGANVAGYASHGATLPVDAVVPAADPRPLHLQLGTHDHLFPAREARRSAQAFAEAGHDVALSLIGDHTHWLYEIGPWVAAEAHRALLEAHPAFAPLRPA